MDITMLKCRSFRSVATGLCSLRDFNCLHSTLVYRAVACRHFWKLDLTAATSISMILPCTGSIIVSLYPCYVGVSADTDIVV
jgi:hypothetical protein